MGRPVNKRIFGTAVGNVAVTSYYFSGGEEAQEPQGSIVKQTGTNYFLVTDGTTTENLQLVNGVQDSLGEGEFIVNAKDDSGTATQVTKFYNRTVITEGTDKYPYTLSDSNAASASVRTVDVIT